jgi:hypothetical protein
MVQPDQEKEADPLELQQQLMRFSDMAVVGINESAEEIAAGFQGAERVEFQKWRLHFVSDLWAIATGENPFANLLDMFLAITLLRVTVEEFFVPKYGECALPMLQASVGAEAWIGGLTAEWLSEEQLDELRQVVDDWRRRYPDPEILLFARALGISETMATSEGEDLRRGPSSVFSLLKVDPLSGMEPATREMTQARMAAERGLYIVQRIPHIVRGNAKLFSYEVAELSEMQQVLANMDELTALADRFTQVTEQLPTLLSTETERILELIQEHERDLIPLVSETRLTLDAGSQLAGNVEDALAALGPLLEYLDDPDAEPFRIKDYAEVVEKSNLTVLQTKQALEVLERIVASDNLLQLSSQVAPVVQQTQSDVIEVVDHVFRRATLFVVIACALILLTALLYRAVPRRRTPV